VLAGAIAEGGEVKGLRLGLCAGLVLGVSASAAAFEPPAARTKIGAFVTSLADIQESQRRFDITLWVWLLSPADIGAVDPARTLEITNAVVVDRQYAVTSEVPGGRWSQVKFRATIRAPLDFTHFPFDRHVLRVQLEDAERDLRRLEFVPDEPPNGRGALAVSSDLDPQDWQIGKLALTVEPHVEATTFGDPSQVGDSAYSRATLGIEVTRRHSLRILLTLLLGTFMSSVVAFFAVLLPIQQSPPRYTLLSSALFVCIANRLLVDSRLPAGSSLGLLDQLQLLNIVGLIALAGVSLVLTNFAERRIPATRATQLSQRIGCGWLAGLAVLMIGLVALHSA
jgi:hypothetical protein